MLDKKDLHRRIETPDMKDYGVYLAVDRLLDCQKPLADLCTADELQFQIVHQVEELWMKLIAFTLGEIDEHMAARESMRVLTLFDRVNRIMKLMTGQLSLLETMSPFDYQSIRLQLGNGSGQESPGFQTLLTLPQPLWERFKAVYLEPAGRTIADVYDTGYRHDEIYMVAEALIEFDEQFQIFRALHIYLIHRSIGMGSKSLKGRPVELLNAGTRHRFFPELWDIRAEMTDRWGAEYGVKRASISGQSAAGHGSGL
ncbi:tryptophan 2,3-dioxygenase family protein [Sphingopyxis sp.]|uniref:tryptophan 2,3-dioxygenase family protein n=1 Tax=Sphingopyxis sp. TaxID=1908224 RepID=UPI0035AED2A3